MKERLCEGERGMNTISTLRMLTATRGEAHQSCTLCGLAFFKKPREATAIPPLSQICHDMLVAWL